MRVCVCVFVFVFVCVCVSLCLCVCARVLVELTLCQLSPKGAPISELPAACATAMALGQKTLIKNPCSS